MTDQYNPNAARTRKPPELTKRYLGHGLVVTAWAIVLGVGTPAPEFASFPGAYSLIAGLGALIGSVLLLLAGSTGDRPDSGTLAVVILMAFIGWAVVARLVLVPELSFGSRSYGVLLYIPLLVILSSLAAYQGSHALVSWFLVTGPVVAFYLSAGSGMVTLFGSDPGPALVIGGATAIGILSYLAGVGMLWAGEPDD